MEDTEIVRKIADGETVGEDELYHRFSQRVYFIALRELRKKEEAEDATSEVFIRLIQGLRTGKLRSAEALPSFVTGITLNVIREFRRQGSRLEEFDGDRHDTAGTHSAEKSLIEQESFKAAERCLASLKERDRQFIRMYYLDELPAAEISRKLGVKLERLRLIKSRALKKFREEVSRGRLG